MNIHDWEVITWKTVRVSLEQWMEVSKRLRHASTSINSGQNTTRAISMGQVLWTADFEGRSKIGVASDWAEITSRYVVLLDPMSFVCNVSVVNAEGKALNDEDKVVLVNDCIHSLPWQKALLDARRRLAVERAAERN
jgi:hypothetical protein